MAVLLLAEHDNETLAPATAKALNAAKASGSHVDILVAGEGCQAVAETAAKLEGVRKVLLAEAPQLEGGCEEGLLDEVADEVTARVLEELRVSSRCRVGVGAGEAEG